MWGEEFCGFLLREKEGEAERDVYKRIKEKERGEWTSLLVKERKREVGGDGGIF